MAIAGLGTALPPHRIAQSDAAEAAMHVCCKKDEHLEVLPVLYRQAGIKTRHMVLQMQKVVAKTHGEQFESPFIPKDGENFGPTTSQRMERYVLEAPKLAIESSRTALDRSKVKPTEITHLVTVSCTGFSAPGADIRIIKGLGLRNTAQRVHIGFMGCHGALNGLRVARAFTGADPNAKVLLCCVELCSLHFHYGWDPKKLVANALFADGSAAVVGVAPELAPPDAWQVAASGSCLVPDSEYAMTWDIGDHGFDMTLSTRVPNLICDNLRPWLDNWLAASGLKVSDIKSWAIHPGGPRILTAVEKPLGLDENATAVSREVLSECGNMSSPTVLFILDRLRQQNAPRPCVALGFGPGLMAEGALFT
jgi:prepilin-type processing-associated H-X9-DG protein